jgi:3-dehydro-L-gulonate 2-dehydrogenase
MARIPFETLKSEFKRVLIKKGCPATAAEISARIMAESSCDGVYSHGVNRFPRVVEYINRGHIKIDATPTKISGKAGFEQWDGNQGLGNVNAKLAMDRAVELSRDNGIGCVALRNTNHWLRGGTYGWQAADAGCIGICWTNTMPNMPAWGAKDRRIGNNPFIVALPHAEGHVVIDCAMAQFSYGQMENAQLRGLQLPVPGGYDQEGNITADPAEIAKTWRVLPIGFWKGSGLSILLDLVGAVLSGGNSTYRVGKQGDDEYSEYNLSQVFIAIDAKGLIGQALLAQTVAEVLADIKASDRVDDRQEILYPGEKERQIRQENTRLGIPVDDGIWKTILAL